MNIFILNDCSGEFYFKPDTTFCKENADFYFPHHIELLKIEPLIATKILKSGKFISSRFANRYYSKIDFALNIFHNKIFQTPITISELTFFSAIDSSFYYCSSNQLLDISEDLNIITLFNRHNTTSINLNIDLETKINQAIEKLSSYITLKSGDIVAISFDSTINIKRGDNIKMRVGFSDDNYDEVFDFLIK